MRTFRARPYRNGLLTCAIIGLLQIYGCTTLQSDKRPDGVVIERNKQTRPVWSDAPTDQLVVNATEAKFHYALNRQRDLPIAVKQAQTSAIEASYPLWKPNFDERLKELPNVAATSHGRAGAEYATLIEQVSRRIHARVNQVEDIYYERVRIDQPDAAPDLVGAKEYFDVHVLVQILPVESEELKHQIASSFSSAKSAELRKIAKDLTPPPPARTKVKRK